MRKEERVGLGASCVLLATLVASGCARGPSAEERQIAQLREELSRVQADHDRFEQRLTALEIHGAGDAPAADADGTSEPSKIATPLGLKVIRLAPPRPPRSTDGSAPLSREADDAPSAAPAPPPPRTDAKVDRSYARGDDAPARRDAPAKPDASPKRAYDAAVGLVKAKKYADAVDAFAAFLVKWPDSPSAANAMYYRGAAYDALGNCARAAEQYAGLLARFPLAEKAPDALGQLATCQQKLGNASAADETRSRLRRDYPRSDAAKLAAGRQEEKP